MNLRTGPIVWLAFGTALASTSVAAPPCPPPTLSVSGGTSVTTACPTSQPSGAYSTSFPVAENPLSDGGKWINGKAVGLDWNNVQTSPGSAYGADYATGYNDPIAVLNTNFSANQYATGTVRRAAGYAPSTNHEVELHLRLKITPHVARGYEVLYSHDGWLVIVRWNGPLGSYTELASSHGPVSGAAADGDVIRAEITGSTIKVYKNGSMVLQGSDTTWTDGQPGIGFWPKPGTTIPAFAWRNFAAGSL
jgi:hypothetical protein